MPLSTEWFRRAACRGAHPDLFYPPEPPYRYEAAKRVCAACAVTDECLEFAVRTGQVFGVWGGLTPQERRNRHLESGGGL